MIDIIIPAYNNHSTIEQALCSLSMQINRDELQVIILNDGGKDYSEIIKIFSRWLNIKEIQNSLNEGPGFARNKALNNSNSEYVMFMDADDTFISSYAIAEMKNIMDENPNICFTMSNIVELQIDSNNKKLTPNKIEPNLTVLFGKMYRRQFLTKYNIRFQTSCFTEDLGFNTLCALFARKENEEDSIAVYSADATYVWTYNKNSFSRGIGNEYGEQFCIPGYIYNHLEILKQLEENNFSLEEYLNLLIVILFTIYIQYNSILTLETKKDKLILFYAEELSRHFFYKYYHLIRQSISSEEYTQQCINIINETQNQQRKQIHLKISLDEFVELMFSKTPKENLNYLHFEQELLHNKQLRGFYK